MSEAGARPVAAPAQDTPLPRALRLRAGPWPLLAPALALIVVFFGVPTAYMLRMSLNLKVDSRFYVPDLTLANYREIFTNPIFIDAIWNTVQLALAASLATVVIGYGFALLAWLKPPRWRMMLIGLALCPLLISEIAIIFGWWMFFPKAGLLSWALVSSGVLQDKVSLMYTEFAAFVGLVYITLPYCFFIILSILDGIDRRVLEASADLGGSPLVTFREVLLPLTRPGLVVAFSQAFIWTMGIYATPSALGPDTLWTMGFLIQDQMLGNHNWPLASAFSMILVVGVGAVIALTRSMHSPRTSYHA